MAVAETASRRRVLDAGSIRLSPAPLVELRSLKIECVQTDVHLAADDRDGSETVSLSRIRLPPPWKLRSANFGRRPSQIGTTLVVGNADVTGRSITHLKSHKAGYISFRANCRRVGQWMLSKRPQSNRSASGTSTSTTVGGRLKCNWRRHSERAGR